MGSSKKLKSLALILRSLPPRTQKIIFEQLPLPLIQQISDVDMTIDEQLSQEDWDSFSRSWPEFASLIDNVNQEAKVQQSIDLMRSERSKVREYLEYRLGNHKDRPNISFVIAKIIDEMALN